MLQFRHTADYIERPPAGSIDFSDHTSKDTPLTVMDGNVLPNGRSRSRPDGSYAAYDLKDANPGDTIMVITEQGAVELTKVETEHDASALEGWAYSRASLPIGKTLRLVVLDPNPNGAPFLTGSIVLKEGLGLRAIEQGQQEPKPRSSTLQDLGTVAIIASQPPAEIKAYQRRERWRRIVNSVLR